MPDDAPELAPFTPREDVDAYFIPRDDVPADAPEGARLFDPTIHAQGTWRGDEQHLSVSAGLMVHCIEGHEARDDMQLAKITFDVLGVIPLRPSLVSVRTIRPGRTIELVEAEFRVDGRLVIAGRAWRLSMQDSSPVAGGDIPSIPSIDECVRHDMENMWPGAFIRTIDRYDAPGGVPGRNRGWFVSRHAIVAGERSTPTARFLTLVDGANGFAVRVDPSEWMFPNVDLTIHLFREPDASALGLDTTVAMGETGLGVTMTTLHDVHGPVGQVAQSLTVRELPPR